MPPHLEVAKPGAAGTRALARSQESSKGFDPAAVDAANGFSNAFGLKNNAAALVAVARAKAIVAMDEPAANGWRSLGVTLSGTVMDYHTKRTKEFKNARFVRFKGVLKAEPLALVAAMMDPSSLLKTDKSILSSRVLYEWPDKRTRLITNIVSAGAPFAWRTAVEIYAWQQEADGTVHFDIVGLPTGVPVAKGTILATTALFGYRLRPLVQKDGTVFSEITLVSQVHGGGMVPSWIANPIAHSLVSQYVSGFENSVNTMTEVELRAIKTAVGMPVAEPDE